MPADDAGMPPERRPPAGPTSSRGLAAAGQAALAAVIDSGLLRCAVPTALGGDGRPPAQLQEGAVRLAETNAAAGWVLWAQRLAIEALVHSPNIGVRDHLLPDLIRGERAGTLPLPPWDGAAPAVVHGGAPARANSLVGMATAQGLRLYGQFPCVPNLQWQGHVLVAPLSTGQGEPQWVVLRGEEDGMRPGMDLDAPCPRGSRCAALSLDGVFFRANEELAGPELPQRLAPVARALGHALLPARAGWRT